MGALPAENIRAPSIPGSGGLTFGGLAREALGRIRAPFQYDPSRDPRYQALTELARIRGEAASRRALEELNARGILNSTITAERLGQIQQAAEYENVLQFLPQMYQQALELRQQDIDNLMNLARAVQHQEQFGAGLQADLYRFSRDYSRSLAELAQRMREFEFGANMERARLQSDLYQFGRNYSLAMAQLAQRMREFEFDANMRRAAFEMDRIIQEQQLSRQTNPVVTSRVIGQVIGMSGPDEAFRWLSQNAHRLAADGADLSAVLGAIISRWPEHFHVPDTSMMIPFGAFSGETP
nr:MAG: hypothetical protein DIU57_20915 [Pseudomonadota bacterium]